ncbi:MAG: cyclic pyranopterin monophosphate synthase MoaC [Methanobacteriota archaeon]|nr:MAG: cyclic pyranopterin monophosphate synthase MoaC [Euryarchaeota archaeon]
MELTHVSEKGVRMVEVSDKPDQMRRARARGRIRLRPGTIELIKKGEVEKGNVLTCAQVAAVMAVKNTPSVIPMCHPLQITGVDVGFNISGDEIEADVEVRSVGKTGVEMEAVTGVAVALLTIWDMVKSAEKDESGQYPVTEIGEIKVVEKQKR